MRKTIQLDCPVCNKTYLKSLSEYKRNLRLSRTSYCSLSCSIKARQTKMQKKLDEVGRYPIKQHSRNRKDKLTPFRYLFKGLNNSNRKENQLSLQDLQEIWEEQAGKCAITQLPMILPTHTTYKEVPYFQAASLDRIDSSIPYTRSNVQYILRPLNLMKNNQPINEMILFLESIQKIQLRVSSEDSTISSPL